MSAPIVVAEFLLERTTKNTYRYSESVPAGGNPKIGTVYLQKSAVGGQAPKNIRVSVEVI